MTTTDDAEVSGRDAGTPKGDRRFGRRPGAILTTVSVHRWGGSIFGFVSDGRVRRRPSDLVRVALSVLVVAVFGLWASQTSAAEQTTYDLLSQLPGTGQGFFRTAATGMLLLAAGMVVLALALRRFRLAGTIALSALVAAIVALAAFDLLDVEQEREAAGLTTSSGSVPEFPAAGMAIGTAALLAAVPYLTRPMRRLVAIVVPIAGVGTVYMLEGLPSDVVAAIALGWGTSALAHLTFGSPAGTPTVGSVERALAELGIEATGVTLDPVQTWGTVRYTATGTDGQTLAVRVIGRDATDAQLLTNIWQSIWYKESAGRGSLSRLRRVEREAYLLLLADRGGVAVPTVVAAGEAGERNDAVLVVEVPPGHQLVDGEVWPAMLTAFEAAKAEAAEEALARTDPSPEEDSGGPEVTDVDVRGLEGCEPVDDDVLDGMWATLAALHDARLVHGDVCPENLVIGADGRAILLDLNRGDAGVSAEDRQLDRLGMLVAAARVAGPVAAVASAHRALGEDGLTELLPRLQPSVLAAATRHRPLKPKVLLGALRDEALRVTGADAPELVELRRVSPMDLLMAAATILGIYLLSEQLASVDDLWATLTSAELPWVMAVIFFSQMPQVSSAVTVIGAVHAPLPFGRVVMLQFANGFTGLVGGTAANTALIVRFFQKQGLSPAVAVGSGLTWSVAGFIAQVTLVTICIVIARPDLGNLDIGSDASGSSSTWAVYMVGLILVVGAVLSIPRVRHKIALKTVPHVREIRQNFRSVISEPRKAAQLFGGALATQIFFALSLDSAVHAYGGTVAFSSVVLTNSFASLVGGLAPIPGGMGVTEAGMITGLTAAGVPQEIAVAATLLHRTFTYYLPPTWGWGALNWLRNRDAV